jgi:hypothetical protein
MLLRKPSDVRKVQLHFKTSYTASVEWNIN